MRVAQEILPKSNNIYNVSKLQSAGGKLTELLEQTYSIHCDQNNSKMILSHGKYFFFHKTLSSNVVGIIGPSMHHHFPRVHFTIHNAMLIRLAI